METAKPVEEIMTTSTQKNGYMKLKDFVTALLAIMVIIISLWAFSVSDGEFTQFEKRIDDRFNSFEKRFDLLEIVLREIKTEVRDLRNIKK